MKEQIHTIPVNEAFLSEDECPFCYLERQTEQRVIHFTVGPSASYMEPTVREITNREGFCRHHLKQMYDYGNSLGNALILQSHMDVLLEQLQDQLDSFHATPKRSLFQKHKPQEENPMLTWAKQRRNSCFVCGKLDDNMERYYHTFFVLLKEPEFRSRVENCKGFCMRHFTELMERAPKDLPANQQDWFYPTLLSLMRENLRRVKGDLDWFVSKFDYRNAGADWKNSRDAVSRTMQKLQGLHPADPPFRGEK